MPAYPIPNWLHGPPDPAQILLHSHQIGAQIAEANARLQQQSQLEQIKLDLEQEREDRQSRQKQQEIEIEKSYHDQLTGLKQKELEEAQQRIDLTAKAAAQKYQAMQDYQNAITPVEEGGLGMDPSRAILKFGPMMGGQGAPESAALRESAMAKRPEAGLIDVPGGGTAIRQPSGTWTPWTRPEKERLIPEPKFNLQPSSIPGRPARIRGVTGVSPGQLEQFGITNKYNFGKKVSGKQDASSGPLPLPKTEKELLEGQLYQTAKGLGMWDASQKKFKLVPQAQSAPTQEPTSQEDPEHPPDEE